MNLTHELDQEIAERADAFERELFDFLRIRSISRDPARAADMTRAAGWLVEKLRDLGMDSVEAVATQGPPVVLASRHESDTAPTVLVYGHYDVQPPEPLADWSSDPFEPAVRGGRLYARGATDDKGQVHMHLVALELLRELDGRLPVNVKLLIEGEEETGSPSLADFVRDRATELGCDVVLISDSEQLTAEVPAIGSGFRGIAFFALKVRGPAKDLHSGQYGGAVTNPANALTRILSGLQDGDGRIAAEGLYDDVREPSQREREALRELPFDETAFLAEAGVTTPLGDGARPVLEKVWYQPSLDLHALRVGAPGDEVKTAISTRASALFSVRLVPEQRPRAAAARIRARVEELTPAGVEASLELQAVAEPWQADLSAPVYRVAAEALEEVFGNPCTFIRGGGTLPIVPLFEEVLGAPVLLVGFGLPGSNPHGPDEWLDLGVYRRGIAALVTLYRRLGASAADEAEPREVEPAATT